MGDQNPFMEGGNPYMKGSPTDGSPPPVSPGDVMGDSGMGGGASMTTKPRQMPGGPDPMDGGMGGNPMADSVPQDSAPFASGQPGGMMAKGALVRTVRRDIARSNPSLSVHAVHDIAMRVVALIAEGASPMGPVKPTPLVDPMAEFHKNRQQQRGQQGRAGRDGLPQNDTRNPRDRRSVMHPRHPQHALYFGGQQGQQGEDEDGDDRWQSVNGGNDPLVDRAIGRGYQGNNPHLFGLGDAIVQRLTDKGQDKYENSERAQRVVKKVTDNVGVDRSAPVGGVPLRRARR